MKEHILEVLVYLFEHHFDNPSFVLNEDTLADHLQQAGFNPELIQRAFTWLDELTQVTQNLPACSHDNTAMRILDPEEARHIDQKNWGFILRLEQLKILDSLSRELVIDRLMNLEKESINLHQIKWVTLMVLYSQRDQHAALRTLEEMILNEDEEVTLQ